MKTLAFVAAGLLAAVGSALGVHVATTSSTASLAASVWVAPGGAGCPSACPSFQTAFNAAAAGDTVGVRDGVYPAQTVSGAAKASAVSFVAENPGEAKVASLSVSVDRVHFVGVVAAGTGESRGSLSVCSTACAAKFTDVVFDGFHGKSAFLRGSGITVIRSEFGAADGCKNLGTEDAVRFWAGGGSPSPDNDSLIDSEVHDWRGGNNGTCDGAVSPTPHLDCVQNQGGTNMVISGNSFHGCPSNNIQMSQFGTGNALRNVTVDNNYLGVTACCNGIVLGVQGGTTADCPTLKISNNRVFKSPNLVDCAGHGVVVSGNTLCSSTAQAGCEVPNGTPPPPPVTTTVSTTTAPPTTTTPPPPPPPVYHPSCESTCDEQIAALKTDLATANAALAAAGDKNAALVAKVAALKQAIADFDAAVAAVG